MAENPDYFTDNRLTPQPFGTCLPSSTVPKRRDHLAEQTRALEQLADTAARDWAPDVEFKALAALVKYTVRDNNSQGMLQAYFDRLTNFRDRLVLMAEREELQRERHKIFRLQRKCSELSINILHYFDPVKRVSTPRKDQLAREKAEEKLRETAEAIAKIEGTPTDNRPVRDWSKADDQALEDEIPEEHR